MKRLILLCLVSFQVLSAQNNNCNTVVSGRVIDDHDGLPLAFAEVVLSLSGTQNTTGAVVDSSGNFILKNICSGTYTITAYHIGCTPVSKEIRVNGNDLRDILLKLEHHSEYLKEALIIDKNLPEKKIDTRISQQVSIDIENLKVPGITVARNGANVQKPVIRGLSGNRVTTVNRGIIQQDQQWGQDHALAISFYPDDDIEVIKGGASLKYGTEALGGVLKIKEPLFLENKSFLGVAFKTNGLQPELKAGHTQIINDEWAFRLRGAASISGDQSAPDYLLTNTSNQSLNLQGDLRFKHGGWTSLLSNSFDHRLSGILLGSHIGNQTDFYDALERDVPFYTGSFDYETINPKQWVDHFSSLLKTEKRFSKSLVSLQYSYQNNHRREFDVRRGNYYDIPAMNLLLQTHHFDAAYKTLSAKNWNFEAALNSETQINTNISGTGVQSLLPNFNLYKSGFFALAFYKKNKVQIDLSTRADYQHIFAQFYERTDLQNLKSRGFNFVTGGFLAEIAYNISEKLTYSSTLSYLSRPPAPNELLSRGLHHAEASIIQGDSTLSAEHSFNWSHNVKYRFSNFTLDFSAYFNPIKNFIYLEPQPAPRTTSAGTFFVYNYKQNDALLGGIELSVDYKIFPGLTYSFSGNHIYAQNLNENTFLPLFPSDRLNNSIGYKTTTNNWLNSMEFKIDHNQVFKQQRLPEDNGLPAPPPTYALFNAAVSKEFNYSKTSTLFSIRAENLFNNTYRDYLDRLRYYSNRPGINLIIECLIKF